MFKCKPKTIAFRNVLEEKGINKDKGNKKIKYKESGDITAIILLDI